MTRAAALLAGLLMAASGAAADCRQALALGLDVSGSVDAREYRLQISGIAEALKSPEVRDKLLIMPAAPIRILVYEWSGPENQFVIVPWTEIGDEAALTGVIELLAQAERREASPGTALGQAMRAGADHLAAQPWCWKRTLDLSGDGKSNLGPSPSDVKQSLAGSGITINALVIGVDNPSTGDTREAEIGELSSYFRAEVILGPNAFVQTALGYGEYARAMKAKLLRELEGIVVSRR